MATNKQSRFDNHIDYKKYGPGPGEYHQQSVEKKISRPRGSVNHLSSQIKEINSHLLPKSEEHSVAPGPGHYNPDTYSRNTNTVKHIYHDPKSRFQADPKTDSYLQSQLQKQNNLIMYISQQQQLEDKKQEIRKQMGHNNYFFKDKSIQQNLVYLDREQFQQDKHNVKDFKKLQDMNLNQRSNFNNIANQIIECYDLKEPSRSVESNKRPGRIVINYQVIQPYLQQKAQTKIKEKKQKERDEPGPGCYEVAEQKNKKNVANLAGAIMKSESLRQFQQQAKPQNAGPGSYNSIAPNRKKTFNYNFKKGWI